jgi:2-oxo-4-hydroxy-4-carboxy--5-ureidoimidazoline (OHCU) decarboxylase
MNLKRLNTWTRKTLSRIYGPVVEQGMWIISTSLELQDLNNDLNIAADIKKKILEWIGHAVRMDHGRVVKKVKKRKDEEWEDLD